MRTGRGMKCIIIRTTHKHGCAWNYSGDCFARTAQAKDIKGRWLVSALAALEPTLYLRISERGADRAWGARVKSNKTVDGRPRLFSC